MKKRIYLDHNATTPVHPRVIDAMQPFWAEHYGNPSSVHLSGQKARATVENARRKVAGWLQVDPSEIVFTSGATESNQIAIEHIAHAVRATDAKRSHIAVAATEHPSVVRAAQKMVRLGFAVDWLTVDADGSLNLDQCRQQISEQTALISVQTANHETGVIHPLTQLSALAQQHGAIFHTDATQAALKTALTINVAGIHSASLSGHKIYAPKGIGILYLKSSTPFDTSGVGGHQERGYRGGTENVAAIVGLGTMADLMRENEALWRSQIGAVTDRLRQGLLDLGARENGASSHHLCNTVNVGFPGISGELLVQLLDLEGVSVSTGAACSSGSIEASPVLLAMGQSDEVAREAVRFSTGLDNTIAEIDFVLSLMAQKLPPLRLTGSHG